MMSKRTKFDSDPIADFHTNLEIIARDAKKQSENKKIIYLAAPWFDERALLLHDAVKNIEQSVVSKYKIYYPKDNNEKYPEDTFRANVSAITSCDCVIALISRKDVGTAWEIGYAYALSKKIYLVVYDEDCFTSKTNLMLAYTGRCFTIDKLAKFLTEELDSVDYIYIDRMWEEVE